MAMHNLPWIIMAVVLFAGCSSAPPAEADDVFASTSASSTSSAPVAPLVVQPRPPVVGSCEVTRTQVGSPAGAGVNIDETLDSTACHFSAFSDGLSVMAGAVVEATWSSSQPTTTTFSLSVEWDCPIELTDAPGACDVDREEGTVSPLRIELDGAQLNETGDHNLRAYIGGQGLLVQQSFRVYVSLFPDGPVPADYTAVPA
jgi:hypothetical protein